MSCSSSQANCAFGVQHSPGVEKSNWHARLASQALSYVVTPSLPQIWRNPWMNPFSSLILFDTAHSPWVEPSNWHAALARHSLAYVRSSLPQTGLPPGSQSAFGSGVHTLILFDTAHSPWVEPSNWHAALARHSLAYVRSSLPQTGLPPGTQSAFGSGVHTLILLKDVCIRERRPK